MRPTLRQLEYAVAVAEHRHFRRAAEACHVTQPALSAQVAQLEEILGVRIFDRNRRQVQVTAAGEQLLERVRSCLAEVDELEDLAAHLARPGAGPLRLGVIPTIAPYLLPALLPALRREHPDYELQLWEAQTTVLVQKLDRGELDLLLLAVPLPGDERPAAELGPEPFVLVVPEEHRLAHGPAPTEEQLDGEPLLLLAEGHCLRQHALAACRLDGRGIYGPMHANSLSMLVQMVRNGLGLTLLPASAIEVELNDRTGLAVRRFREPGPSRMLGALWRDGGARSAELESLARFCASHLDDRIQRSLTNL